MTKIAATTARGQEEEKTAMGQYKSILNKANGGAQSKKKGFFSRDKEET